MTHDMESLFGPPPGAQEQDQGGAAPTAESLFGAPVDEQQGAQEVPGSPDSTKLNELFGQLPTPFGGGQEQARTEEKAHVRHSPSSAPRWTRCPGSIIATDGLESKAGPAADEGTAAHHMLETCLLQDISVEQFVAKHPLIQGELQSWPAAGEMQDHIGPLVEEYRKEGAKRGVTVIPERRLYVHETLGLDEPLGGTADITIFRPRARELGIEDLKYGKNATVRAAELDAEGVERPNEQLMIYLLAAYYDWIENHAETTTAPIEKLYICIRQPRAKKKRDRKSVYRLTVDQLLEWEKWLVARYHDTKAEHPARIPGEKQCTFCQAKKHPDRCPEYASQGSREAEKFLAKVRDKLPEGVTTEDLYARDPTTMTLAELNVARLLADDYERQAKLIKAEVEKRLASGQAMESWKLVHGNSTRYISDAKRATAVLEDLAKSGVDRSLLFEPPKPEGILPVAQLEKNLDPDVFEEKIKPLVGTLAGKAIVAPASSRKPKYDAQLVGDNASGEWVAEENPQG